MNDANAKAVPALPDAQTVTAVTHYTDRLFSFRVTRPASLRFRSGEFVMIGLTGDPHPETGKQKPLLRAYSIASPSWDEELEFYSIKVEDGPLTSSCSTFRSAIRSSSSPSPLARSSMTPCCPASGSISFPPALALRRLHPCCASETYEKYGEVIVTHTCRDVADLTYGANLIESIKRDEMMIELLGEENLAKIRYYPTTTREKSAKMGRITTLIENGELFTDLGVPPLNPATDRAMVCGSLAFNKDIAVLMEAAGLHEGANSEPGEFVIEKAFVG